MPTISMFYGIIINMYNNGEHNPPHFHATYQDYKATFDFDGKLLKGSMPQNKFKLIEELNKKMKSIDSAINKISNMLNDTKGLDLTRGEMPQLIKELEALGIEIPKNKKMSFEQASSFVRTIENKRDEHDRDMKMGQSKFQETLKDLESIRQVLFQMMSYLRETLVKITSGMRAS